MNLNHRHNCTTPGMVTFGPEGWNDIGTDWRRNLSLTTSLVPVGLDPLQW